MLAATVATLLVVNPLGFIGGGWDDWQYLNAVRCWREYGPCLPHDHWQARWPVIAPVAAITWLFGESRLTVDMAPLIEGLFCLVMLALIGNRLFGKPIGWIASILMATTPAFSIQLLDVAVEAVELAFCLAGLLAIVHWIEKPRSYLALLAALSFSMAVQTRETAFVAATFACAYALLSRRSTWRDAALGAIGFAAPFLVEFATFGAITGDPLWRRHLALNHVLIPSFELMGSVDPTHSPILNPSYIAHWRREPGIYLFWPIDGLLNLFANAKAGLSLLLVPLLAFVVTDEHRSIRRSAWILWGVAIAYACVLIYFLAIDPKARTMFMPLALTNTALAMLVWRLRAHHRSLVTVAALAGVCVGLFILYGHQRTDILEAPAARWIAQHPSDVEIDDNTRRHLALVRAAEDLPPLGSGRHYLLYNSLIGCGVWLDRTQLRDQMTLSGEVKISSLGWLEPKLSGGLCLLRYIKPVPKERVVAAIERFRPDGRYILAPRLTF